jgi:hypothetical protein
MTLNARQPRAVFALPTRGRVPPTTGAARRFVGGLTRILGRKYVGVPGAGVNPQGPTSRL